MHTSEGPVEPRDVGAGPDARQGRGPDHHRRPVPAHQLPSRRSAVRLLALGAVLATGGAAAGTVWSPRVATAAMSDQPRLALGPGGRITRGGVPFRAAGVNLFQLALNDYPSPHIPPASDVEAMLDAAQALGAVLVRSHTLGASVGPTSGTLVKGVTGTTRPVIQYDPAAWDAIDRVVASASRRGLHLVVPLVDELGYFHGGKRNWVAFRRPGTLSLDWRTTSANAPAQRAAEALFYTDPQVRADFRQYVTDWLTHVNRYTGRRNADEPAVSVVETGNELWTAPQDGPGWTASTAELIKSLAPRVLVADGSAADGVEVESMAWASPAVDVLGTHPYGWRFGPDDVRRQAAFAASKGKAYLVGEYPWSADAAPRVEEASRAQANLLATAPWSLQLDDDLHSRGAAYGSNDVSLYVPGKDAVQRAAVARLRGHARALETGTAFSDDFSGSGAPSSQRWFTSVTGGGSASLDGSGLVLSTGGGGASGSAVVLGSAAPLAADRTVQLVAVPDGVAEVVLRVVLRARWRGEALERGARYALEVGTGNGGAAWFSVLRGDGEEVVPLSGRQGVSGATAGRPLNIEFGARGTELSVRCWAGDQRPTGPSWSGRSTQVEAAGATGLVLRAAAGSAPSTWRLRSWAIS